MLWRLTYGGCRMSMVMVGIEGRMSEVVVAMVVVAA
jgi:hypothetical protein